MKTYTFPKSNFMSGVIAWNGVLWFAVLPDGAPSALYRGVGSAQPTVLFSSPSIVFQGNWGNAVQLNGLVDLLAQINGNPAVVGVNSTTGKLVWTSHAAEHAHGPPVGPVPHSAGYDNIYLTGVEGVAALSASTGKLLWTVTRKFCRAVCDPLPDEVVFGRVAVADHRVYVSARNGAFALDPSNGHVTWHYGTTGDADASPSVANGLVYTFIDTDQGRALAVLTESSGTLKKSIVGLTSLDPIIYGGQVYVRDEVGASLQVLGVS